MKDSILCGDSFEVLKTLGAGTVGLVANRLGRNFIGIELNPSYIEIARQRIYGDAPLFNMGLL